MVKSHIGKIKIDKNIFEEMHYLNKIKNKNTLLLTCHFGGVELIPTTLTLNGMSAAVFVNYKTHAAKNGQISNANDIGLEIFPIGDNLSRKIIYLRKNPRVTMLVCDAFDYWKRENTDKETVVFGRKCRPDQGVDRLAGLMEASVYWGYMKRKNMEEYEFIVKKLHPDDNSYTDAFLKEFEQLINKHPDEYYAWHDMDQLYEIKVMSNV
jgi:lauroyl/myristoyl acyltransferase